MVVSLLSIRFGSSLLNFTDLFGNEPVYGSANWIVFSENSNNVSAKRIFVQPIFCSGTPKLSDEEKRFNLIN